MGESAHIDPFVRNHLPPPEQWPRFIFDLPELQYPPQLNASTLLDRAVGAGHGDRTAVVSLEANYSYGELLGAACQIARVLTDDLGLVPGNRVLLHAPNRALTIASWFAVLRAGGVVVTTMPMLRAGELQVVIDKAEISYAIIDPGLAEAVSGAQAAARALSRIIGFDELHRRMGAKPADFTPVLTAQDDPALIAFTSGTTGRPKGCVHFHRDVLAMADTFARHILDPWPDDVFCGTPPFAFTFGLGASVVFPLAFGARTALCARPGYDELLTCIERHGVTTLFTAPTAYRALLKGGSAEQLRTLKTCVSAGEALPAATSDAWFERTGIRIIDGIGSTEMIHIFISAAGDDIRPGATGKPVPGFVAALLDDGGWPIEGAGQGRLAVRGPTGCRYLADERQRDYVIDGWNVTGDVYRRDADGYYWFVSRADDMIISSGYNIAAPEVERAILTHPAVLETAVIGVADESRGQLLKAYIVLHDPGSASDALKAEIQDQVKRAIAPYKYPRAIEFVSELPKTQTGKIQRFRLRDGA